MTLLMSDTIAADIHAIWDILENGDEKQVLTLVIARLGHSCADRDNEFDWDDFYQKCGFRREELS